MKRTIVFGLLLLTANSVFANTIDTRRCSWDRDLFYSHSLVPEWSYTFTVTESTSVIVTGQSAFEHRNLPGTTDQPIGIGIISYLDGVAIPGAVFGANIRDYLDHYLMLPMNFSVQVAPGTHTISFTASAHTAASPGLDGLAEIKPYENILTFQLIQN